MQYRVKVQLDSARQEGRVVTSVTPDGRGAAADTAQVANETRKYFAVSQFIPHNDLEFGRGAAVFTCGSNGRPLAEKQTTKSSVSLSSAYSASHASSQFTTEIISDLLSRPTNQN